MNQKQFLEILKKYRLGNASEAEKKLVDAWYEAMGKDAESLHELQEFELEQRYWYRISTVLSNSHRSKSPSFKSGLRRTKVIRYSLGMAASWIIVLILFYYMKTDQINESSVLVSERTDETLSDWKQITNAGQSPQKFTLSDGSTITLEPQSWIRISPDYNLNGRYLHLQGQAFFEVAHNEAQPFVVNTDGVVTKVLGTSFTVKAFDEDEDVTVFVRTGRVSVFNNKQDIDVDASPIILTPNQQIVYDRKKQSVSRSIVEVPIPVVEEEAIKQMRFDDAPVKEIFEAIEKIYGIELVFDEARFASCTLTTLVSGGDLYNRLDIITQAIGVRYEVKADKIVIIGSGCN